MVSAPFTARARHTRSCAREAEAGTHPCGGMWTCRGCGRLLGYCEGSLDDKPDHCDECWAKAHGHDTRAA